MAIRFNGTTAKLDRTVNVPSYSKFTICGWVQPKAALSGFEGCLSIGNNGATQGFYIGNTTGGWGIYHSAGSGVNFPTTPSNGQWVWICLTMTAALATGYQFVPATGKFETITFSAALPTGTANGICIGSSVYDGTDLFNGNIENVKVWDAVLTVPEVLAEIFTKLPQQKQGLHAYYPLPSQGDYYDRGPYKKHLTRSGTLTTEPFFAQALRSMAVELRVINSTASGVSGTLAVSEGHDTLAAAGTTTILGTLAKTNNNDTLAAAGTTTISGSLAKTNQNDTSAASGTTTVVGTLAKTNADDTLAASGSVGGAISGTLAKTNQDDTSAASGTTKILGTLAKTNGDDTSNASGAAGTPPVGGNENRMNVKLSRSMGL
jgi:hypothetical protein